MELNDIKAVYFIGAGGIGMSAIARFFIRKGLVVAGYDRTPTALTHQLEKEGMVIHYEEAPDEIPHACRDPKTCLVVYTAAIPAEHKELQYFRDKGFVIEKRAQVLGTLTRSHKGLCFAGTHGKTSTSTMCAHILHQSHVDCNAFLGGISKNYGTNYLLSDTSDFVVIEADEFDRSFHWLSPWMSVITATDPDHLDIYGTEEAYLESFAHFTELVRPGGALVIHEGLKLCPRPAEGVATYSYSRNSGDFHAENITHNDGEIHFDFIYPGGTIRDINLGVPVEVNIENAVAALAACYLTGDMEPEKARQAIGTFMGPKRRFEFYVKEPGTHGKVMIDDYAHHPDELKASINSVKTLYPHRELTVAFQPHLYTRTRDFVDGFAEALDLADQVILLDIYPARELPIEGVTSKIIFDRLKCTKKALIKREDLIKTIKNCNFEILLTAGAGDISEVVPGVAEAIKNR